MKRLASKFYQPTVFIISFAAGFTFYHYSIGIWNPVYQGNELTNTQVENLRKEAISFFYQTMPELFEGTYDPKEGYVSNEALNTFDKYKSCLEPRCRLIDVYFYYGVFFSEALFPSGDRFEVTMRKVEKGWRLDSFRHLGSGNIYYDGKENK
jgi:hypothetical protein